MIAKIDRQKAKNAGYRIIAKTAGIVFSYDKPLKRGMLLLSNVGQRLDEIENSCSQNRYEDETDVKNSGEVVRFKLFHVDPSDACFFESETIVGCKVLCESYFKKGRWIVSSVCLLEEPKIKVPQEQKVIPNCLSSRRRVRRRLERVNQVKPHNLDRPWLIPFKNG